MTDTTIHRSTVATDRSARRPARFAVRIRHGLVRATRAVGVATALLAASACGAQEAPRLQAASPVPAPLSERAAFGAFTSGGVWQGMEPVVRLEARLGRRLEIVHWFMNWDHAYDPRLVDPVLASGAAPLISWQPHRQDVRDIADGRYDAYLRSVSRSTTAGFDATSAVPWAVRP